jgi:hypothetical protein
METINEIKNTATIKDGYYWFKQSNEEPEIIQIINNQVYQCGNDITMYIDGMQPNEHQTYLEGILGKEIISSTEQLWKD